MKHNQKQVCKLLFIRFCNKLNVDLTIVSSVRLYKVRNIAHFGYGDE